MKDLGLQRAGQATAAYFFVVGIIIGAWASEIPSVKEQLGEGTGLFGAALLSIAGGAIVAMPLAGALINRFGSRPIMGVAGLACCLFYPAPVLASSLPVFLLGGFGLGATLGLTDVAMNTQGLAVEHRQSRPLMSRLHGMYSLGGLFGAFAGGTVVNIFGSAAQALLSSILSMLVLLLAYPYLLPAQVDKGLSTTHFGWPTWQTVGLGILCFLALMGEGAFVDWSGLFLSQRFQVDAGTAASGFALFSGGMALSRFGGDQLRTVIGAVALVRFSALLTAGGVAASLLVSNATLAITMFVFAGIGIGNLAPLLFAGGGRLEPMAPARGIAAVTTLGYLGLLAGPPLIGIIAEFVGLGSALWIIAASAIIIALGAGTVRGLD